MGFDPRVHHRRSIRLPGHDYGGGGAYFITICIRGREFLFGEIVESAMVTDEAAGIVKRTWHDLPKRFPSLVLDAFQIMPNHLHGVIVIPGAGLEPALAHATGAPIIHPRAPVGPGLAPAIGSGECAPGLPTDQADASVGPTGLGNVLMRAGRITSRRAPATMMTRLEREKAGASPGPTLGRVVGAFKSLSAIPVNQLLSRQGQRLWQEDYFEHIIRNVGELQAIRDYIIHNPQRWREDPENPKSRETRTRVR